MSDIKEKLDQLYKESEESKKFTNVSELEEFTKEEKREIEDHLKLIRSRIPPKPKEKWVWSVFGIFLLMGLAYAVEFLIIWGIIWQAIPYVINISWMTLGKSFVATLLITAYRIWKKTQLFKLFEK